MREKMRNLMLVLLICLFPGVYAVPDINLTWNISYGTISPLGVPQQGILINGQFPGPLINCTGFQYVNINIFNNIDEPFLMTWSGLQHRKNSWADGVPGTNCPIPPGKNYTMRFQVKDQIGTFMYYPSTAMHKAAGGFGVIYLWARNLIPVPYPKAEDDFDVLINDWYTKSHAAIRKLLDNGRSLGRPNGVLINGKAGKPDGKSEPMFIMKSNKTYKYRICNTGIKTSLNVRIQGHMMQLVEMEGSHPVQNFYESLDVHVGQCYTLLVTANQTPKDYYMVVSTRFLKQVITTTAVIRYAEGKGPASPDLPKAPIGWAWSLNQFRSFRWNLTANAARPNPQGSFKYGKINITRTIKLVNTASKGGGKLRYAFNGVSHVNPPTPLKLAQYYGVANQVFKYNSIPDDPPTEITNVVEQPNVLNVTYRKFVEIIFENHEKSVQSFHIDGYAFFAVAIEPGKWTPEKRKNYNLLDAVSRHTIQVFPKSWAAILMTFDNAGMWNVRSEMWDRTYLGQQLYISVLSPKRSITDEYNMPDNAMLCGVVANMPKPEPYSICGKHCPDYF